MVSRLRNPVCGRSRGCLIETGRFGFFTDSYRCLKCALFLLKSLCRASARIGRLGLLIPGLGAFLCRWVIALSERVGLVLKHALRSGRGSVQACFRERRET